MVPKQHAVANAWLSRTNATCLGIGLEYHKRVVRLRSSIKKLPEIFDLGQVL
jgi:hypothetical protein